MTATFRAMGCEIVVEGASTPALRAIERLFVERDRRFSRFVAGSELNHVNAAAAETVLVSDDFARAVRIALRAAAKTGGLVDPTIGAAIRALGYTVTYSSLALDHRPVQVRPGGRWRSVGVTARLLRRPPGLVLDLNGVVKGLTVDDAARLLDGPGFVSAGGDIAVTTPTVVSLPGGGAVTVRTGGLATSGTARRWWRGGGERHHLVDPATGLPSGSAWREVTVAARSCLEADVAAKAAFLLDTAGPAWLDEHGLAGRFLCDTAVENTCWRAALTEPVRAWA